MRQGWTFPGVLASGLAAMRRLFVRRARHAQGPRFEPLREPFARSTPTNTHHKVRTALYALLLVVGGHTLILAWQAEGALERERVEAEIFNLAARQRMHSQRIGRIATLAESRASARQSAGLSLSDVLAHSKADADRLATLLRADARVGGNGSAHPFDGEAIERWAASRDRLTGRAESLLDSTRHGAPLAESEIAELHDGVEQALSAAEAFVTSIEATLRARHEADVTRYRLWAGASVLLLIGLCIVVVEPTVAAIRLQNRRIALQTKDLERLALVAALTKNAVLITDRRYRVIWVNEACCRITGFAVDELLGQSLRGLLRDRRPPRRQIGSHPHAAEADHCSRPQLLNRRKDGSELCLEVDIQPLTPSGEGGGGVVVVAADVTEWRRSQVDLRIAATAFESLEAMAITDASQTILRVNSAFTRITGYTAEEARGKVVGRLLKSGRHEAAFYAAMWEQLRLNRHWQGEVWNRRKDGRIFPEWLSITAVTHDDGSVANYVAVFTDITEKKLADETIHNLAFYDPLTDLPNRRLMRDRLTQLQHQVAAVLFIDLDKFKELNDTRGHDVGDALLIEVARRLRTCVRAHDTVARQGGDEFVIILASLNQDPHQALRDVEAVAEKVRRAVAQPYKLGDAAWHCTASIGICMLHGDGSSTDEILKRADIAMYEAKRAGRNTARFYDPATQAAIQLRTGLETDLRQALSAQQLSLHFQPQVDADYRTIGAEVLLRWTHPLRGAISPGDFIPLAEDTDLILPIGQWVLQQACQQLSDWSGETATSRLQLAVNVSARQFRQPEFVDQVRATLHETGADPRLLKLELTETLALVNIEDTLAKMKAIREMGVRFAIDDFGTGQSSLAYLTRLSLDQLKIDQAFVASMLDSHTDRVIVQTMIGMATTLGLEVVAEGVETQEQLAFLKTSGCYCYQGYLFGRPVPLGSFMERLNGEARRSPGSTEATAAWKGFAAHRPDASAPGA